MTKRTLISRLTDRLSDWKASVANTNDAKQTKDIGSTEAQQSQEKIGRLEAKTGRPYDQRPEVLIAGATASVGTLAAALVAFGFRPIGVFSPSGAVVAGSRVPIDMTMTQEFAAETGVAIPDETPIVEALDEAEFIKRAANGILPIFIDDIARGDTDHFNAELRYVRYKMRLFGNRVLHPAALVGLHSSRAKTYMFTGFPSSGNMVFQRCLSDVLAANTTSAAPTSRSRFEGLLSHYALSHWYALSDLFVSYFQDFGLYSSLAAPCGFGLGAAYMDIEPFEQSKSPSQEKKGTICISGAVMWHHAWANPYHASHEPITRASAAAYRARNVSCVQIVRHPLDVLVSNAGKPAPSASSEGLSLADARNEAVISLMNCDSWVYSMIDALEKYYCAIAAAKDQFDYLTYEDLLSDPVPMIKKMATIFGCAVTDEAALGIWQQWADTPAAGEAHRWDPRAEKWKEFVPARFAGRLIGSKLETAAKAFGYSFRREDFQGPSQVSDKVTLDDRIMALEEGRYSVLVGKEIVLTNDGFYNSYNQDTGLFVSGPAHVRGAIDRLLGSSMVKEVLAAGCCFELSPNQHMGRYVNQIKLPTDFSEQWRAMLAV